MKVYLAGPLFGVAEREFNQRLAELITAKAADIEVFVPQLEAAKLADDDQFMKQMFHRCIEALDSSDAVLAVMDGSDSDSGTCIECGYAFARGIPIVGVRTDLRASEVEGLNLMVAGVCRDIVHEPSMSASSEAIASASVDALRKVVG